MVVKQVMEALMVLFGKDPSWSTVKKLIVDKDFLHSLFMFKVESVTKKTMRKLRENYISQSYFRPASVKKVSRPCTAICKWIISVNNYH